MFVKDTDIGKHLLEEISDLRKLLEKLPQIIEKAKLAIFSHAC